MTSNVEICNVALTILERRRITDLLDGSDSANDCNAIFVPTRQNLIRSQDWNFARKREKLAQLTETPVSGFDFAYQLPTDWLRTQVVSDNDRATPGVIYRMEGDTILSDASDIYLTYSRDVEDPALMDAAFRQTFSWEIATIIAKTTTDAEMVEKKRKKAMQKASSVDSIEDYPDRRPLGSWTRVRAGNGTGRWNW